MTLDFDQRNNSKAMSEEELSPEKTFSYIESLRHQVDELKQEKADLEILLQTITEHADTVETQLQKKALEAAQLNQAYQRFVPHQFLQFLNKKSIIDVQLGDHVQQEMSVLFSDIRDFTQLSEQMTPEDNFKFINAYLSRMEPAITENNGFIDKYIGDEIMALFSGGADDAVRAGITMLQCLTEYNQHRANSGYPPIQIGIGINSGSLMLGTVGGHSRMDSTVISDAVNLASRLESLTKIYSVPLLISHHTFLRLEDSNQYAIRLTERVMVKGKSTAVSVYEVFDADPQEVRERKLATRKEFEQALLLYNYGNLGNNLGNISNHQESFNKAAHLFEYCLQTNPQDKLAHIYLERCRWSEKNYPQHLPPHKKLRRTVF